MCRPRHGSREIDRALGARWKALQALIHMVCLDGLDSQQRLTGWKLDSFFYINSYGCQISTSIYVYLPMYLWYRVFNEAI